MGRQGNLLWISTGERQAGKGMRRFGSDHLQTGERTGGVEDMQFGAFHQWMVGSIETWKVCYS